ncbi:hypothetical protein NWE55_16800 (plasmid) [Myroides albus]|uniref:Uncharacterized protein n=1 Tax=Myroides odoratimimus TaxID=76832 RepID=A0AAI8C994_9FLAO|nr:MULTISPECIES: hypothetical protein [Myroides]ALU28482.1 hypothetical protein AS202_20095 [Myroides odoratimimus]UVD81420.1 hypothetical protein NWE55_16800 [Myroides albus]
MIVVKHPLDEISKNQQRFIDSVSEQDKEYHSLLFSYGNSVYIYYQIEIEPTLIDYEEWLEGLSHEIKTEMQTKGFEECKTILSFTRYVLEKSDIGMEEFVKQKMGIEKYNQYKNLLDPEFLNEMKK